MCTALTLTTNDGYQLFGRNMDIEFSFNQSVLFVPRQFAYRNVALNEIEKTNYAMIGMGTLIDEHPCFADAMNEKGLACAGLNFPGYAYWEDEVVEGEINIPPYDLILWILSNFETVKKVKNELENLNIVGKALNENTPLPTLHWIVTDKTGESIVIEKTREKLSVFENKLGVLTNAPTFDWHTTNLDQYIGVESIQLEEVKWGNQQLKPLGQGTGGIGLPGDFSSPSRFIKVAFLKSHSVVDDGDFSGLIEFYHILNAVAMVKGSVVTRQHMNDITQYTCCMSLEQGIYYYNTYNNNQINAIDLNKEDLNSHEIKVFEYKDKLVINYEN